MTGHAAEPASDRLAVRSVATIVSVAVAAVLAATGVGFWLSYGALHHLAVRGGLSGAEAWAWPCSVDLFILSGECTLTLSYLRRKVDRWALAYFGAGAAWSVTGNLAHVYPHAMAWLPYAVAATPPVAATAALSALLRQVHRLLFDRLPVAEQESPARPPRAARAHLAPVKLAAARDLLAQRPGLNGAAVAEALGVSKRTGQRYLNAVRQQEATADA